MLTSTGAATPLRLLLLCHATLLLTRQVAEASHYRLSYASLMTI